MSKPKMTKAEKAFYLANFANVQNKTLSKLEMGKWIKLHFTKTF